jgi:uncharacterized protein YhfF
MKKEHTLKVLKDAYEIRSGNGTEKITYWEESQSVLFIENVQLLSNNNTNIIFDNFIT